MKELRDKARKDGAGYPVLVTWEDLLSWSDQIEQYLALSGAPREARPALVEQIQIRLARSMASADNENYAGVTLTIAEAKQLLDGLALSGAEIAQLKKENQELLARVDGKRRAAGPTGSIASNNEKAASK